MAAYLTLRKGGPILDVPSDDDERANKKTPAYKPRPYAPAQKVESPAESGDESDEEVPEIEPAPAVKEVVYTAEQKDAKFWEIITSFSWRNASDGPIQKGAVKDTVNKLTPQVAEIFEDKYNYYYAQLNNLLAKDGTFPRCEANTAGDISKTVSHIIAMGKDMYNTVLESPSICDFFIGAGECQDLDDCLPAKYQH